MHNAEIPAVFYYIGFSKGNKFHVAGRKSAGAKRGLQLQAPKTNFLV
jgi:hypothetical protein